MHPLVALSPPHKRRGLAVAVLVAAALSAGPAFADTVNLEPVQDNTAVEDSLGSLSNGAGSHCFIGITAGLSTRRALLQFDLSAIPSNAIVTDAELQMTLDRAAGFSGPRDATLHVMQASWGEGGSNSDDPFFGGGQGAPAQAGDATWFHRFFPTDLWAVPGGDFDPAVLATTTVLETPGVYTWGSTPELVAAVQAWVSNGATNFGFMLRGDESTSFTSRRFVTRESTVEANRPHLIVTYTTAPSSTGPSAAHAMRLDPAVPNPFNPTTTLHWETATGGWMRITVLDVRGTVVSKPFEGMRAAGPQSLVWQARDLRGNVLPSGVYVVRLEHDGASRAQRVVLVR